MKIQNFLLLTLLLSTTLLNASGNGPIKYGDVSMTELKMTQYEKDTSAAALILFNKGSVTLDLNSTTGTVFERHMRIKIFHKTAFDEWANFVVLIGKNGLKKFNATTYNLVNGKIEKSDVNPDHVYKKKYNKYVEEITFAFPNVKEGSILEVQYTELNESAYLPAWQFQYSIPVAQSEYTFAGPSKIIHHLRGTLQPTSYITKYNGAHHHWLMMHVPAFKSEPLMPNKEAYLSLLESAINRTWEDIYLDLMRNTSMGQIVLQHNFLKARVKEITAGMTTPLQKIKAISQFIKGEIRWNGISDYLAYEPKEVLEKKTGSAGDINLLFASMLKKAGINVALVLLSTRENGFVLEAFPSARQFNYVVCHVTIDGKDLFFDATEKNLPYDILPPRCLNHKGFLISLESYGWIGIEPIKYEKISVTGNFTLTNDGDITGHISASKDGYAAFETREKLYAGEDNYKNDFFIGKLWNVHQSEIINTNQIDKPLLENYSVSIEEYATVSNDLIYVNPFFFLREDSNPFAPDGRAYPVDFNTTVDRLNICNITIPDGYIIEELPQSKAITLPGNAAKGTINISVNGNKVMTMYRLQINKTLFMPDEYPNLKEFYARLVSKMSENIILKKKT